MTHENFLLGMREVINVLGIAGALMLLVVLLLSVLTALYLVLHFGETSFREVVGSACEMVKVLRYEPKKTHPAIRLELRFQMFFILTFFLTLSSIVVHTLIPWVSRTVEDAMLAILVSSFVVNIFLTGVSLRLAVRLA